MYRFNYTELIRSTISGSCTFPKLFITLKNAFSVSLRGPPGNQSLKQSRYGYRRLTLGSIPGNKQNQQVDLISEVQNNEENSAGKIISDNNVNSMEAGFLNY